MPHWHRKTQTKNKSLHIWAHKTVKSTSECLPTDNNNFWSSSGNTQKLSLFFSSWSPSSMESRWLRFSSRCMKSIGRCMRRTYWQRKSRMSWLRELVWSIRTQKSFWMMLTQWFKWDLPKSSSILPSLVASALTLFKIWSTSCSIFTRLKTSLSKSISSKSLLSLGKHLKLPNC